MKADVRTNPDHDESAAGQSQSVFVPPSDRIEALVRTELAVLAGSRPELIRLGEWFGEPVPLPIALALALFRQRDGDVSSYAAISDIMTRLATANDAEILASTFGKPYDKQFADLDTIFSFSGEHAPKKNPHFVYFTTEPNTRQTYTLPLQGPCEHGIAVHFSGYVHSGTSDHFFIRLIGEDGASDESVRIGVNGLSLERSLAFRDMPGAAPRLVSLVAEGRMVHVFVDGLPIWRHERPAAHKLRAVVLELWPREAVSTDCVMLGVEVWRFTKPFSGLLEKDSLDPVDALSWFADRDEYRQVYTLLNNISNIDTSGVGDRLLAFMERTATRNLGYLDWAIDAAYGALPPDGKRAWDARRADFVPRPALEVEDLRIDFFKDMSRASFIKDLVKRSSATFSVIDGVSFKAYEGDVIGIIGHNGAGKSTLLRALAGLIPISRGRIRVKDSFMLLRGGLGMRPHLSGRENVISAGIYMGLTPAQARALIPDILAVSELGEHFDRPTKYYSDGMMSRLVFAVATSVSPEILFLDELLGAGDISFQEKARKRLEKFLSGSRVIVIVTHSIEFVRKNCNKALVLSHGKQLYYGEPTKAVSVYLSDLNMSLATREEGMRF